MDYLTTREAYFQAKGISDEQQKLELEQYRAAILDLFSQAEVVRLRLADDLRDFISEPN